MSETNQSTQSGSLTIRACLTAAAAVFALMAGPMSSRSLLFAHRGVEGSDKISEKSLRKIVDAATRRWEDAGLDSVQVGKLSRLRVEFGDLPGAHLGSATREVIVLDHDANGNGWFVDKNPMSDKAYRSAVTPTERYATANRTAARHVDLLTAVMHEMGHVLGFKDTYDNDSQRRIMYGFLRIGVRRLPHPADLKKE